MSSDLTRSRERTGLRELAHASGLPLGHFRDEHLTEQLDRACERAGGVDLSGLASAIAADAELRTRFRRSVAISYGAVFRDPSQFELLERELLPPLLAGGRRLSAWSAGCGDGSELYTLGVVLERLGAIDRSLLLGSDLLEENLAVARRGRYRSHVVSPAVRARVRWERRDIVADGPPSGHWRLVLCRNVAIYLGADARERLHAALAAALAPDGVLLLGRSERLLEPGELGLREIAPHAYVRVSSSKGAS
jgi:chemotaxis protein methyltransferase CheR